MRFTLFLSEYVLWHYTKAIRSFFIIWRNMLWFAYNFFSIPLLVRTLFSPFQRITEEYRKGLDVGAFLTSLLVNVIMRCVGAFVRTIIVGAGFLAILFILAAGIVLFVAWVLLPLIIVTLVLMGVHGLAK